MLALLALLASLQEPLVERVGRHFKLVSHLADEKLADEALGVAEAAWPLALAALELKEKKLPEPLVIHLYADAASYEAAEQQLSGGAFKANLMFSHFATKSAHVALHPPCTRDALRDLGLPLLTAYGIAHEASHLVSYAFVPNSLDHPEWFAEGMAQHVAFAALVGLGRMRAGQAEPLAAKSAVHCQALLATGKLPEAVLVLAGEIGDLDFYPRYAVNRVFYELLLAEHGKDLQKSVAAIKKTGGGEGYRAGLAAELGKIWKEKELAKLAQEFTAHVKGLEPEWDEVLRSLETRAEGYVQRAFAQSNAVAFRTAALTTLPLTATGTVKTLPGDAHQMNFLLGRSDKGFLSVAFTFGLNVTVFRCDYGPSDTWTVLGTAECGDLRIGTDVPFRIEASAAELVVSVAGKEAVRAALNGRSPLGAWGLGAQAKTTGEWKAVVVKAGP